MVIGLLIAVALVDRARTGRSETLAFVAIVGLGEIMITYGLKLLVTRERPDVMRFVHAGGYSFPSGHTSAVAVAASRVLLGVHWLTDVIAGLAIGWGWFVLVAPVEQAVRPSSLSVCGQVRA